jgi:ribonuclease E
MAKRMLIDATHPEETRVVVLNGNRLEEFDFESSTKKQVKGNIYLAKVTRVEPSLQAAFVDYGNHRHGFLAFSEIHPDYYKVPVGDREPGSVVPNYDEPSTQETQPETDTVSLESALPEPVPVPAAPEISEEDLAEPGATEPLVTPGFSRDAEDTARAGEAHILESPFDAPLSEEEFTQSTPPPNAGIEEQPEAIPEPDTIAGSGAAALAVLDESLVSSEQFSAEVPEEDAQAIPVSTQTSLADSESEPAEVVETLGGDELEEAEHHRSRTIRHYKIQEVIKRRQIMLVQVAKEERGNKGAALTTYLSLAGRYCVLMPNTARGGGVSRKITSITDRRRLKDILEELDIPEGMGVIVRTAGAERSKAEIKRDYEYLLRLWNEIRDLTLQSTAPALIYEEGNLIKRSIRDLYTRDIDEVLVEGEEGYRTAKAFMKMLMPSHAKRVQPYRDTQIGLFHRFQVESQIDAIHSPIVQLRSGGYIVINQTEALVAIDVNSGRATRERNIEETAVRTNLEAAEEIARQLRLRDLAGLIVIDFIDMEEHRNQAAVERRLKETLKYDRARIQVGRISAFGLLEMSRQRLRPSLVETSTQPCPHCGGTGTIRSTESTALYVLRSIEEEGMRRRSAEICVHVPTTVALYILNQKRDSLVQLESRYEFRVLIARDDALIPPTFRLERLRAYGPSEAPAAFTVPPLTQEPTGEEEEESEEPLESSEAEQDSGEGRGRTRRRRRRRRRHEEEAASQPISAAEEESEGDGIEAVAASGGAASDEGADEDGDAERRRRRRGRRGGRRRGRREAGFEPGFDEPSPTSDTVEILPATEPERTDALVEARAASPVDTDAVVLDTETSPALSVDPRPEDRRLTATSESESHLGERENVSSEPSSQPGDGEAPTAAPSPGAEVTEGEPYVRETERLLEAAQEPHTAPPAHPVQTVTEKPANPRRGWWQRLIQS